MILFGFKNTKHGIYIIQTPFTKHGVTKINKSQGKPDIRNNLKIPSLTIQAQSFSNAEVITEEKTHETYKV